MRYLVTGCAGFIGSHLTESLLSDGHEVVGVDCFNDNYGRADKLRNLHHAQQWDAFEFVPIDLSRGELSSLVEDCDVVCHLAAEPGVRPSWGQRFESYVRNNVSATQHLLEAMHAVGGRRLVYASSSSVYGQAEALPTHEDALPAPHSPYGVTKLSAEQLCRLYSMNFGVDAISLRLFSVYGPRQRPDMAFNIFCRALLDGEPLRVFGDGRQSRDFTYVGDVVTAFRAASTTSGLAGQVMNIGGAEGISLRHAIGVLEQVSGRVPEAVYEDVVAGDVRDTAADTTRARELLGFEPRTGFLEGLAAEWEWMAARQGALRG